jgi:hypothetical protein
MVHIQADCPIFPLQSYEEECRDCATPFVIFVTLRFYFILLAIKENAHLQYNGELFPYSGKIIPQFANDL